MKNPALFLALMLSAAPASFADNAVPNRPAATRPTPPRKAPVPAGDQVPLVLGPKTAEGFNDPEHLHFFRYQLYLVKNGLTGLDEPAWKALNADQRAEKIKTGEGWLKDKLSALMSATYLNDQDSSLLASVWGPDVAAATQAVNRAIKLGDPDAIKAARTHVQSLVKGVGGAAVDWAAIFDGAAPGGTVVAPQLPDPLALKKPSDFLASLSSPEVRAPLASKATFVHYLEQKQVPADALPALTAMYDVLTRAKGDDAAQTAHLLPTLVRFLNDGKKIVDEDMKGALGFAVPGEYDRPERVGITPLVRTSDPVVVASVLAHEFQHIHDMYAGRYYTLDSELRGFKTNVLFLDIMKSDPAMKRKLDELMNSDDDSTRSFFRDHTAVAAAFAQSPQAFADMVAFGHGYNENEEGVFQGRLTVREATSGATGLQRQISAQRSLLEAQRAQSAALEARLSTNLNDHDMEKVTKDLAGSRAYENRLQRDITLGTLRLNRMKREVAWMDQHAAASGTTPPAYDLTLPVGKDYVVDGSTP